MKNIDVEKSSCLPPCSGLIVTGYSKSEQKKDLGKIFPVFDAYNQYKIKTEHPSGYEGSIKELRKCLISVINIEFRLWMEKQFEVCKNLFWHSNIYQSHQG